MPRKRAPKTPSVTKKRGNRKQKEDEETAEVEAMCGTASPLVGTDDEKQEEVPEEEPEPPKRAGKRKRTSKEEDAGPAAKRRKASRGSSTVGEDTAVASVAKTEETDDLGVLAGFCVTLGPVDKPATKEGEEERCPICMCEVEGDGVVGLARCKHRYHKDCLAMDPSLQKGFVKCAVCGSIHGTWVGDMPKGEMRVMVTKDMPLAGYPRAKTIVISYSFNDGKQGKEHPKPGKRYYGTQRTAYLPDNKEGRRVLRLLYKAFLRRQTFTVGTSVTTGATDSVVWNGIHHKTNTHGGSTHYGYPDPTYFARVTEELAARGVAEEAGDDDPPIEDYSPEFC